MICSRVIRVPVVFGVFCVGCAGSLHNVAPEKIDLPEEATEYTTEARSADAYDLAAADLRSEVKAALAERGSAGVLDAALSKAALSLLHDFFAGHSISGPMLDAAARRHGFGGTVYAFRISERRDAAWRDVLESLPGNFVVNRFGVTLSPSGRFSAVVFGNVSLEFEPVARFVEPGSTVNFTGEISERFASASIYLTKADGSVEEFRMPARKIDFSKMLKEPGNYRLEVMAHGPRGPEVLSNLPLFVGVQERSQSTQSVTELSAEASEARIFELINRDRSAIGLPRVERDDELRAVALGHSEDMEDANFFAHVSPTTGTPTDRVRRAGVLVSAAGENIAQSPTPEDVHEGLMSSPGHRSLILSAQMTHVGIAVVKAGDDRGLIATEVFGRRPAADQLPRTAAEVEAALLAVRGKKGLSIPKVDALYRKAAARGAREFAEDYPEREGALRATVDTVHGELRRANKAGPAFCTAIVELLELSQLDEQPLLLDPGLIRFGVGTELVRDAKHPWVSTAFVLEGVRCGQ